MGEAILKTMFYLAVILLGLPTVYFLSSTEPINKSKARKIYALSLFLIMLITVLIYGVNDTKKTIGYAFGDFVIFIFYAVIVLGLMTLIILLFLGNWKMLFDDMKRKLMRKRK